MLNQRVSTASVGSVYGNGHMGVVYPRAQNWRHQMLASLWVAKIFSLFILSFTNTDPFSFLKGLRMKSFGFMIK